MSTTLQARKDMYNNLAKAIEVVQARVDSLPPGTVRMQFQAQMAPMRTWMMQVYKFKDWETSPVSFEANHDRYSRQLWIIQGELAKRTGDAKIYQPTTPDMEAGSDPIQPSGVSNQPVMELPMMLPYTEIKQDPRYWTGFNPSGEDFIRAAAQRAGSVPAGPSTNSSTLMYVALAAAAVVAAGMLGKGKLFKGSAKKGRRK